MTTLTIRTFEPGDGTRYRYATQFAEDNIGSLVHMFSFGVGFDAMITFDFPADNDFIPYTYFVEKYGRFIKNEHTLYVAYVLFCRVTGRDPVHHEGNPSHDRDNWNWQAWWDVEDYGISVVT